MNAVRRILLSAYACEPGAGSEPGIGWHTAVQLAESFEVWVLTRANNRDDIEREIRVRPRPNLRFVYSDLPRALRWWKRGRRGMQVYYYLWQLWVGREIRRVSRRIHFHSVHHITFGRYWMPSPLAFTSRPFVWGPVGGGDSAPPRFRSGLSRRGSRLDRLRRFARRLGERDPLVRATARRTRVALASTPVTASRLRALGARDVRLLPAAALPDEDAERLGHLPPPPDAPFRLISVGLLLYWKAFDLGLRAFAESGLKDAEYLVVGDGPERPRLESLARNLGIDERIRWMGAVPRETVLQTLGHCHVLVHPSLHDSGGWVCLEAMAAGRPVLCLDIAGPSVLVPAEAGILVPPCDPSSAVAGLAEGMRRLASEPALLRRMADAAKKHVHQWHRWEVRGQQLREVHATLAEDSDS